MELAADGGVGGVGVGPFGIGGELEPQAALGGLLDEGVAVDAGAAGLADGSCLAGLGGLVGLQGGFEGAAFGFGDFGEFVGGGFVVDRLAPAFEHGAAVGDLEADAVFGEGGRVFGEMLLPGAGLELADEGDESFFGHFLFVGALFLVAGGADGGGAFAAGGLAKREHCFDGGFGNVVVAGHLSGFEGDQFVQVIRLEGGAADFFGLGERGELGLVEWRGSGARFAGCRGGIGGGVFSCHGFGIWCLVGVKVRKALILKGLRKMGMPQN